MNYQPMTAGDVRDTDTEQRRICMAETCHGCPTAKRKSHTVTYTNWKPASLVGHPILRSDLMHLQFRKPL